MVPAVLPEKGVEDIISQGMKGMTKPLTSDPWQMLLVIAKLSMVGSTSVSSMQATGYFPVIVGLKIAPIIRLLEAVKVEICNNFMWNLRPS